MASLSQFGGSLTSEVFSSLLLGLPTGDYYLLTLPSLYFIYGKITFIYYFFFSPCPPKVSIVLFAWVFAVNSAVHSFLILKYCSHDKVCNQHPVLCFLASLAAQRKWLSIASRTFSGGERGL